MTDRTDGHWYDDDAGPVVRPYAMTRGRTRGGAGQRLDRTAFVVAERPVGGADAHLGPEHVSIAELTAPRPHSVAELADLLELPSGVVRVLVGDLLEAGVVRLNRPIPPAEPPEEGVLRLVIAGLRAL
ncbi:DUF742 domain-containing protein [Streptomyces sp. AV19]|uniref:DUF742 domain-containing protein n=1 Tax=Streptomyces sp. AV19 TaxID=2793068 RepID=UPI0018FF10C9|nr:DUF742 domain-containing protein [Streptomyces sp. AV19]MBH1936998.1 DUF742 domain-containing protein [Streptomyces sp. AV19]MDG4533052.1 DUF742 domain-containing protein [Streptomyces sp. AV19]